ncbi:helix-turn-helix domain-containing protein [Clostridium acetobutylicum]|uniref:helix-turn-helix domain-containing protein n=1 Tax=Clostridium acetobutylicum TaxID=1488 RepID=UPI001F615B99|nr:helix-turn-helix domain-containing protein [Clostridium acetobutylicum]
MIRLYKSFETKDDFLNFLSDNILNTNEACEILGCKRQNIADLVERHKLTAVKTFPRDRIFLKDDILERLKLKKQRD